MSRTRRVRARRADAGSADARLLPLSTEWPPPPILLAPEIASVEGLRRVSAWPVAIRPSADLLRQLWMDTPLATVTEGDEVSVAGAGTRAAANTILVLGARVISRAIALVAVLVAANHLGEAGFGRFQTTVTYGALVGTLADLGTTTLVVREGARSRSEIERFLDAAMSLKVPLTLLSLGALALLLRVAGLDDLLVPGFAVLALAAYSNLLRAALYAGGRLGFEAIDIVLESAVLLGGTFLAVGMGGGPSAFLWAYAASYGVSCLWFAAVLAATGLARVRWNLDVDLLRSWTSAALPLAVTAVVTTVYFKVDIPILQHVRGDAEVGIYTNAYKPFEALLFIPLTIRQVVFPLLSMYFRARPGRISLATEKLWRALLATGWPCTVGLVVLAPNVAGLMHLFPDAATPLRILSLGIVVMFVDNTFVAALTATNEQAVYARIAIVGLVANVALNVVLVPTSGYDGASWATVLTEVVLATTGWLVLARRGLRLPIWRLSLRILLAGVVMGLALVPFSDRTRGAGTVGVILLGAAVYAIALAVMDALDPDERAAAADLIRRRPSTPATH